MKPGWPNCWQVVRNSLLYIFVCGLMTGLLVFHGYLIDRLSHLGLQFLAKDTMFSLALAGTIFGTLVIAIWQRSQRSVKRSALRANFSGLMANRTLRTLERRPELLSGRPREHVVTVMFIDMAGFSLSAEGQNPQKLFSQLRHYTSSIQRMVLRHGGTIDKFLGDGILCYFGFDFLADSTDSDHANRALLCAAAIQRANLRWCKEAIKRDRPVYPLRIGLNTGSVIIGDVGNGERFEYTIVGHGVNYAKRMEQCCNYFKIMLSSTTRQLLKTIESNRYAINKKLVQIKHFEDLKEAFEFDPLADRAADVDNAILAFRSNLGIQRKQERFAMNESHQIDVYTDFGEATIVNYSLRGLGVTMNHYLANGCEVTLRLDTSGLLGKSLRGYGVQEIVGEVRWGAVNDKRGYYHGLIVKNLSQRQLSAIHTLLTNLQNEPQLPLAI